MEPTTQFKLSKTIEFIQSLTGGGERSLSWDDVRTILNLITEGHMFIGGHLGEDAQFFRGRQIYNKVGFDEISQLTAQTSDKVTTYGRCHKPQVSVLYASNNIETVYSELGLHVGDAVQTITIKKKPGVNILYAVVGEVDHLRRHGKCAVAGKEIEHRIKEHWNSLSEIEKLRFNLADAFIADRYRAPAKYQFEYKITSAFCDIVFAEGIEALVYPSVGHIGGWNIAIKREAFEKGFDVITSDVQEIYDCPGYGIFSSIRNRSALAIDNGKIEWKAQTTSGKFFRSFDEFIRYHLCQPGSMKTLFAITHKFAEAKFTPNELEKIKSAAGYDARDNFSVAQVMFDGWTPLSVDLDFERLTTFLDQHSSEWDFVTLSIADGHFSKEEANKYLRDVRAAILSGDTSFTSYNRGGELLVAERTGTTPAPNIEKDGSA